MIIRKGATANDVQNQINSMTKMKRGFNQNINDVNENKEKLNSEILENHSIGLNEGKDLYSKIKGLSKGQRFDK